MIDIESTTFPCKVKALMDYKDMFRRSFIEGHIYDATIIKFGETIRLCVSYENPREKINLNNPWETMCFIHPSEYHIFEVVNEKGVHDFL